MCCEDVGGVADVVKDHGDRGLRAVGRPPGGAYAGSVHGMASCPKSKPKTPAAPATGGLPQPHLPNPWDAFAKALGAISPTLDMQGMVC